MIGIHPLGGRQANGGAEVAGAASVAVDVSVDAINSVTVGARVSLENIDCSVSEANAVAVGCSGGADSASASDIPPITRIIETIATIKPPPACFKTCISYFLRACGVRFRKLGNKTLKVEPTPACVSTQMRPFCASVNRFAIDSPTPVSPTP